MYIVCVMFARHFDPRVGALPISIIIIIGLGDVHEIEDKKII